MPVFRVAVVALSLALVVAPATVHGQSRVKARAAAPRTKKQATRDRARQKARGRSRARLRARARSFRRTVKRGIRSRIHRARLFLRSPRRLVRAAVVNGLKLGAGLTTFSLTGDIRLSAASSFLAGYLADRGADWLAPSTAQPGGPKGWREHLAHAAGGALLAAGTAALADPIARRLIEPIQPHLESLPIAAAFLVKGGNPLRLTRSATATLLGSMKGGIAKLAGTAKRKLRLRYFEPSDAVARSR